MHKKAAQAAREANSDEGADGVAQSQAQLDNLRPFTSDQSREEAKKNGRKGGKARAANIRRNRSMNEMFRLMAKMPVKDGAVFDPEVAASIQELAGQNMTAGETMTGGR